MPTGPRSPGEFCWLNILTPDPAAAQDFYAALFGWEYVEIPGMGHRVQVDGHDIGGMWDLASPNTPPGTPPGIGVMVRVDDADAASARAAELGGTGKPAFDVMDQGRMAELHDPAGANIDVWQPNASPGMTADPHAHGTPSWFECITPDAKAGAAFYGALFGWESEVMEMDGGMRYTVFTLGKTQVGGMMEPTAEMGPMPPHWGVYVTVDDADAAAVTATANGGTVCVPPMDIPNIGRFAGIVSPQGVMCYAIRYAMPGS